jgi:hypothetical protein
MTNGTRSGWGVSLTPRPLFTFGKNPVPIVQEVGWLGGFQGRSEQVRKISPPPGFDLRTVKPVASRYTDYKCKILVKKELNTITLISVYYTQLNTSICMCRYCCMVGHNSSVDIANRYEPDGPRIEVRQERDFPHQSRTALLPGLFPKGKAARAWRLPFTPI